jgi:hypothetical protein
MRVRASPPRGASRSNHRSSRWRRRYRARFVVLLNFVAGRRDRARHAGSGWSASSSDLRAGVDLREGWTDDDRLPGGIEEFLAAQRTVARTVSPSASTAIA